MFDIAIRSAAMMLRLGLAGYMLGSDNTRYFNRRNNRRRLFSVQPSARAARFPPAPDTHTDHGCRCSAPARG